jgi:hypothetical protein
MMDAIAVLSHGDPQSLPYFRMGSLPPRADRFPSEWKRITSSGRAFLIELRLVRSVRTAHVDFLHLKHAQAERQIPHQTRMATVQAGGKDKASCVGTCGTGSARLGLRLAQPMDCRDAQQPLNPIGWANTSLARPKCHKRFFQCHCQVRRCRGTTPPCVTSSNHHANFRDLYKSMLCVKSKNFTRQFMHHNHETGGNFAPRVCAESAWVLLPWKLHSSQPGFFLL